MGLLWLAAILASATMLRAIIILDAALLCFVLSWNTLASRRKDFEWNGFLPLKARDFPRWSHPLLKRLSIWDQGAEGLEKGFKVVDYEFSEHAYDMLKERDRLRRQT